MTQWELARLLIFAKLTQYLQNLPAWSVLKRQLLLIEGIQSFPSDFRFLFGYTGSVFQKVHFDIGC